MFKAQNQNKNKTYVIKELALSKLKSKGTLNMLDSVPNGATGFPHVSGAYNVFWKAQHDSVTYKVDLGSTNVLVPYGTGTASSAYTDITNASNGLMVLPQETVLGAFTGSTPEYGTVAEIAASPADASYLYATIAEVDYLTNDTVNRRQVVFRLHDPANKALGIVFEAGRQYTFLLTLGLDGEEIAFSIPTVADFKPSEEVYTPWICGIHSIKGYTTANYSNPGLENLCWTTQNIAEGTAEYQLYNPGGVDENSGRGWYYMKAQAFDACKALGAEWALPNLTQWTAFRDAFTALTGGHGTSGTSADLLLAWNSASSAAGFKGLAWGGWNVNNQWHVDDPSSDDRIAGTTAGSTTFQLRVNPGVAATNAISVRCVRVL
ncbi:hypothetical protein AGMMS49525_18190 [Bacteroidia bacterium]|nr:hypothetical protein AGMMS49525_18190 [Bacteroidia bacterium]